jgi:transposase-like protein
MAIALPDADEFVHADQAPDPEIAEVAQRRRFTTEYKLKIVAEAEACTEPGQVGALLRREGLYSSHLANWRNQAKRGLIEKRGRKPNDPLINEVARLKKKNQRLEKSLAQAQAVIEIQKKLSEIWGIELPTEESEQTK